MKKKNNGFLTTFGERMSYGGYFVGQNIIFALVTSFVAIFYTDVAGIGAGAVATLLLVARVWDAINDPILGGIVDKAKLKKGKFLPWVKAVGILMPLATILVFFKISGNGVINLTYAYITYIVWGMIYTISDVPIFALATTMTDNGDERVTLISIGRFAAAIAGLIAGAIAAPMIASLGYMQTTLILMAIATLVMIPIRFKAKERIVHKRKSEVTLKSMFQAIFKNKHLMALYTAIIIMISLGTHMVVSVYFAKYNLGDFALQGGIMISTFIPMLILPIISPALIKKFGKKSSTVFLVLSGVIFSVIQYFAGYENFTIFLILNCLKAFGLSTPLVFMGMFSADCAEYGAYVTGRRNEGVTFSIQTFSIKLGAALSGSIGLFILSRIGYIGDAATQTPETLKGIWNMMTLVPAGGYLVGIIILIGFYKLKEKDVAKMIAEMKDRDRVVS